LRASNLALVENPAPLALRFAAEKQASQANLGLTVAGLWTALREPGGPEPSVLLAAWLADHEPERAWLRAFATATGDPFPPASLEDLWRLYALHRVLDRLLLHLRPSPDAPQGTLSEAAYLRFVEALGIRATNPTTFHPFDCECVRIEAAPDHARPNLTRVHWPCLMLGPLLLQRAGVDVTASADRLHPAAATNVLHWAHRRQGRPTVDLADGWGSNSQWRTSFRRDYRLGDMLHYQVDGTLDLSLPWPLVDPAQQEIVELDQLTRSQRRHVLRHRYVPWGPYGEELWPWDDTWSEPIADPEGSVVP